MVLPRRGCEHHKRIINRVYGRLGRGCVIKVGITTVGQRRIGSPFFGKIEGREFSVSGGWVSVCKISPK